MVENVQLLSFQVLTIEVILEKKKKQLKLFKCHLCGLKRVNVVFLSHYFSMLSYSLVEKSIFTFVVEFFFTGNL